MKWQATLFLAGTLAPALGGPAAAWPMVHDTHVQSFAVGATAEISVADSNGDIRVVGWDRDQVELTTTKTAWSSDDLSRMHAIAEALNGGLAVRSDIPNSCFNCDISFILRVPLGAHVAAETSSGDVKIESITGPVRVDSSSGDINLRSVSGESHVHASSGSITIDGARALVDAATSSGDIVATNLDGDADLVTSSGDVKADFAHLADVRSIRLVTSSGDVAITVPRGAGFKIEAVTQSGSIGSNLRLPIHDRDSGADVAAQVGDGKASALLKSTSGDIRITMR